jgi:hypothetical protein
MSPYMLQAQQKMDGHAGAERRRLPRIARTSRSRSPGTDRALTATRDGELVTAPAFTGAAEQLWRVDQLADGTYRVMPKAVPDSKEPLALSAVGSARRRSRDSAPTAIGSAGGSRRRDRAQNASDVAGAPRAARASGGDREGAGCRRLPAAVDDPRADPRGRPAHRQRGAGAGEDGALSRSVHGRAARRRQR